MKTFNLYLALVFFTFSSCSKSQLPESFNYKLSLEDLLFKHTNLNELSNYTGVDKNILVGIAHSKYHENQHLNIALNDLLISFQKNEEKAFSDLIEEKNILNNPSFKNNSNNQLSIDEIRNFEEVSHIKFQDTLNSIIEKSLIESKNEFLDSKFSILNIPRLMWDWVFLSKEEVIGKWNNDLNNRIDIKTLNNKIKNQSNSYTDYLNCVRLLNNIENTILTPNIMLENQQFSSHQTFSDVITKRLNNEIYSTIYSTLFECFLSFLIIYFISIPLKAAILNNNKQASTFDKMIWNNNQSFLKRSVLILVNNYANSQRNKEIQNELRTKSRIINIILFIVFIVFNYYLFDSDSVKLEADLNKLITQSLNDFISKQNTDILNDLMYQTNAL